MLKIVLIIVAIIIVYILFTYNKLIKSRLRVGQAKSGIDIYLKQRFDLIPNLVECVKGYSNYEKELLTEITKLRGNYNENKNLDIGTELNTKVNNLVAVVENYPELKASEQFSMLQKNLSKMESQLQAARRLYNVEVTNLNIAIDSFPSNIIANLLHLQKEKLFELQSQDEAKNIDINLTDENK